jgi:aconitate hydratase
MFARNYAGVFDGDDAWNAVEIPAGDRYTWPDSTYVRQPSFFQQMPADPPGVEPIAGARALAVLGDSITTDHISPAGAIKRDGPAGRWLVEHGVEPGEFNSYGSRRGNHEVMIRGTFANIRLRNQLVEKSGGYTRHFPDGAAELAIYEAAMMYADEGVPLIVLAGKEYGSGSSRDWAAKGTKLLGVRAVIAESFERIHRSNLIGMGVLPLQFADGENVESLGLSGAESFDFGDLEAGQAKSVTVTARSDEGEETEFTAKVRLDTPNEITYFINGGILQTVLRNLRG